MGLPVLLAMVIIAEGSGSVVVPQARVLVAEVPLARLQACCGTLSGEVQPSSFSGLFL